MSVRLKIFNALSGFVLPEICVCCEALLTNGEKFICTSCSSKLVRLYDSDIRQKLAANALADYAFSLYKFTPETEIQTLIHSFKYGQMKSIGKIFGRQIGLAIKSMDMKFDFILPVPLHKAKYRERTYNQSEYICRGISEMTDIPGIEKALKRIRYTESQTKLSEYERKKNVKGAFRLNEKHADNIRGKNLILADDLITTGSTIFECAGILKSSGCGKLLVCSAAMA